MPASSTRAVSDARAARTLPRGGAAPTALSTRRSVALAPLAVAQLAPVQRGVNADLRPCSSDRPLGDLKQCHRFAVLRFHVRGGLGLDEHQHDPWVVRATVASAALIAQPGAPARAIQLANQ